ncbi:GGDEF domain-containing protein [Halospina sp. K52047b]|uniref:GGDEF domain-containing protein n=1 Tax=Halospina sp. K52047b TaxID=2614160 RepID=UPI00124AD876|nr:GGDEF domain-containing protein [Halospina sp. K52047b]KAA8981280.1 diguanylate cyclase [Halospina sp. K52047b]
MSDQDWRQKYLAALEQHEQDEKQWQQRQNSLQRLLVRVSLVAEGQDGELDRLLGELRELVREGDPDPGALRRLQDALETHVSGFDEERQAVVSRLQQALQGLIDPLRSRAGRNERRRLRALERTPADTVGRFNALPGILEQLAELQQQVLSESGDAQKRGSFWQRVLGGGADVREEEATEADSPDSNADEPEDSELAAGLDLDSGEPRADDEQFRNLCARLLQLLRHIQQHITLPEPAQERIEILLERVRASENWGQIQAVLDEVVHLVVAAVGRGQREFEQFLAGLDQRLVRLRTQFETGALDFGHWQEVSEAFDQRIDQELDEMGSSALGATELSGLQQAVRDHVDRLNATLTEYREADTKREQALREQVQDLQEKVTAMEAESREVQKELRKERERAATDMLTQLPNREALEERLDQEYRRWHRYREPTSLAIIDIDWFKGINDTYGHLAGDKVLQLLARSLRENLRETDYIARYGGEEFIILLPATPLETAVTVLDKLRERIQALPFHFRHERVEVTFSGGVTGFMEVDGPDQLLDMADRALYRAKEQGRNRVIPAAEQDKRSGGGR